MIKDILQEIVSLLRQMVMETKECRRMLRKILRTVESNGKTHDVDALKRMWDKS